MPVPAGRRGWRRVGGHLRRNGRFCRASRRPATALQAGRLQVVAGGLAPDPGGLFDPPQRPAEASEREDVLSFLFGQVRHSAEPDPRMDETRMGFLADVAHAGQETSCSRPASTSRVAIGNGRRPVIAGIASMRPCGKAASWPPFRKAIDEPATPTSSHRRHGQGTQRMCAAGGILTRPDTARSTRPRWAKPGAGGPSAPRQDHHRRGGVGVGRPASSRCTTAGRRNARP